MITNLLTLEIYQYMLVFVRLGAALMFMPGFSASYVSPRARLCLALTVCVIITPIVGDMLPEPKGFGFEGALLIVGEAIIGIFFGVLMQFIMAALHLVGNKASMAIGFSNAMAFDPTQGGQSSLMNSFFSLLGIVIIFIADLHHLMLGAIIDSYTLFVPGETIPFGDFAEYLTMMINKSFHIGFRIASPFIAFSIILYSCMGLVSRLMPQFNIFFMSLPLQIYLGLGLLMLVLTSVVTWFVRYFEDSLISFLS